MTAQGPNLALVRTEKHCGHFVRVNHLQPAYFLPDEIQKTVLKYFEDNEYAGATWIPVALNIDFVSHANTHWVDINSCCEFFNSQSEIITRLTDEVVRFHAALYQKRQQECGGFPKLDKEVLNEVCTLTDKLTIPDGMDRDVIEAGLDAALAAELNKLDPNAGIKNICCIQYDELIAKRLLVCRQKGMIAASIIANLVHKQILPEGTVRRYRSDLLLDNDTSPGAHAWAVYRDLTTGDIWIIDPRGQCVQNLSFPFPRDRAALNKIYGKRVIDNMINRMDHEDLMQVQPIIKQKLTSILSGINCVVEPSEVGEQKMWISLINLDPLQKTALETALRQANVVIQPDGPIDHIVIKMQGNSIIFNSQTFDSVVSNYQGEIEKARIAEQNRLMQAQLVQPQPLLLLKRKKRPGALQTRIPEEVIDYSASVGDRSIVENWHRLSGYQKEQMLTVALDYQENGPPRKRNSAG